MRDVRARAREAGMISDLDIWRSANLMVKEHDGDAPIQAAMMVDQFTDQGNLDGAATWRRILKAIEQLLQNRPDGNQVH